jgi:hypothetical protein
MVKLTQGRGIDFVFGQMLHADTTQAGKLILVPGNEARTQSTGLAPID